MNRHISRAYTEFACFLLARFPREATAVQIAKALYATSIYFDRAPPK